MRQDTLVPQYRAVVSGRASLLMLLLHTQSSRGLLLGSVLSVGTPEALRGFGGSSKNTFSMFDADVVCVQAGFVASFRSHVGLGRSDRPQAEKGVCSKKRNQGQLV